MPMVEVRKLNLNHSLIFLTLSAFKHKQSELMMCPVPLWFSVCCAPVCYHKPTCMITYIQPLPAFHSIPFLLWF